MLYRTFLAGVAAASLALAAVPGAQAQEPTAEGNAVVTEGTNEAIDHIDPADPFGDIFGDMTLDEIDPTDQSLGANLTDVEKEQLRVRCAAITEPDAQDNYPAQAIGVCTALADQLQPPTQPAGEVEMQDISPDNGTGGTEQPGDQDTTTK